MNRTLLYLTTALAFAAAVPATAQTAAPAAPAAPAAAAPRGPGGHGMHGGMKRQGMFASLSPAGQQIMRDAMRPDDRKADHTAMKASRDQVLTLLDADKLDVAALKRAMDAERATAEAMHTKRQAAMLAAFQKLSVADRKAFVADARAMRDRMDARMGKGGRHGDMGGHGMMGGPGGMDGMDGMMPPPPPPAPKP
jgi:Spy/CpxP family protein refolding chaperone